MPLDVGKTFLNHAEKRQLDIRGHSSEMGRNLQFHVDSGSLREAVHVMTNGVLKSGFIEHWWVQKVGKRADFADATIRQLLTLGGEFAQFPAG